MFLNILAQLTLHGCLGGSQYNFIQATDPSSLKKVKYVNILGYMYNYVLKLLGLKDDSKNVM